MRTKVPKAHTRARHRKLVSQVLKSRNRRQARKKLESAPTCPTDNSWIHDGWGSDEWNDGCSSVGWHEGWEQDVRPFRKLIFTWRFGCQCHSNPKRFESVKMNLDTGAAVNTFPLNFGPEEQEMEDSIGQPVVNGFLMVELGSFKDTMKTDCSDP